MSKGLEELEYLKNKGMIHDNAISRGCVNDIEKELKRLYALEKTTLTFSDVKQIMFELNKNKKVLEIIKEKQVNVFIFLHSGDLEKYNDMVEDNRKLTDEEYDLLKEVLL